jgi:outer membrane protein with beta-barrel domain
MKVRTTLLPRLFAAAVVGLCGIAMAPPAQASLGLGVELGPTFVVGDARNPDNDKGFGFALRLGYKLPLPILKITPEAKLAYDRIPIQTINGSMYRAMIGGKVGLDALLISPNAFLHVGYGHISGDELSKSGTAWDVGVGLDFTLLPVIDLGVFAAYNRVTSDGSNLNWITVGAQGVISF